MTYTEFKISYQKLTDQLNTKIEADEWDDEYDALQEQWQELFDYGEEYFSDTQDIEWWAGGYKF